MKLEAEPGIYHNVALLDIASMYPTGMVDESAAKDLAQALKIAINSVYGIKKGEEIMKKDYRDVIRVVKDSAIPYHYFSSELAQIDCKINGCKVWIDTSEWDGNVAGIMRAIYDRCGYMENHLYHKVKANVETIKRKRLHKVHVYPIESTPLVPNVIQNVIFDEPATIVYWEDGTKTVVICQEGDIYDEEKGLAMAIAKKALGNNYAAGGRFKKAFKNAIRKADRPQGEWIHSHEGTIAEGLYCSNCGKHGYGEKICPNCRAKMKGADDDAV